MKSISGKLAIQWVRIAWDQRDRGPLSGAERNALPRQYPFAPPGESECGWFQQISMNARDDYARRAEYHDLASTDPRVLPVAVREEDSHLWVKVVQHGGKIRRPELGSWMARVPRDKRLAIHFNNAHDGDHPRLYTESAIQVGWGERAALDLPLFREIDLRRLLY